jgi:hypothetical protein
MTRFWIDFIVVGGLGLLIAGISVFIGYVLGYRARERQWK